MSRIRKPSPALVVAVVALLAALGGVAVASPLGSDGSIHLCYSQASLDDPGNGSSAVYVVNAGHACDGDYPDTLTINQVGPRGLPGPVGPQGPQGLPGERGPGGGVKGLGGKLKGQALGDLAQVGKKTSGAQDDLAAERRRLAQLLHDKGQISAQALAQLQQHLAEQLTTVLQQLQAVRQVDQSVIRKLAG